MQAQVTHLNTYLSIAPAAGIPVDEIYRRVLNWKGIVEARQEEDRLARDQPELNETLGNRRRSALASARHVPSRFHRPEQRQAWVEQIDVLRNRKETLEPRPGREEPLPSVRSSTPSISERLMWSPPCPQEAL